MALAFSSQRKYLIDDTGLLSLSCSAVKLCGKQSGNHRVLKEIGISQLDA